MNTITHALLPVVAISIYQRVRKSKSLLSKWQYSLITLAGAAPDLLTPHFSIERRHESWSHTLITWISLSVLLCIIVVISKKNLTARVAFLMSMAYLFHLVCDALSGGIPWLLPISNDILGTYYISPLLWIPMDIVLILTSYIMMRTARPSTSQNLSD